MVGILADGRWGGGGNSVAHLLGGFVYVFPMIDNQKYDEGYSIINRQDATQHFGYGVYRDQANKRLIHFIKRL